MKIFFEELEIDKETINIKFSDTYNETYNVSDIKNNNNLVEIDPEKCIDLDDIIIGNNIKPNTNGLNDKFKALQRFIKVNFSELETYLNSLEENTKDNPYKIYVINATIENLGASDKDGTLGNIIRKNNKYVSLKLDVPENFTNAYGMFYKCERLTEIDTSSFSNVTNAEDMFKDCKGLTEINTSPFTKVTNAWGMFDGCSGLTKIDTASFNSVTDASFMFVECTELTEINTTFFTNVTNAECMFAWCGRLKKIDTTSFTKVTNAHSMFENCTGLTAIDTTPFTNVTDAGFMFQGCQGLTEIDTTPFTNVTRAMDMFDHCTFIAYYSSENDNIYKNYKNSVSGTITWTKK